MQKDEQEVPTSENNSRDHHNAIVRPLGPGHAVAHRSTERHAGAPTKTGIRELLVVFLTLRPHPSNNATKRSSFLLAGDMDKHQDDLVGVERAFYLKNLVQQPQIPILPTTTQARCYQWATQNCEVDGEALFWVGYFQVQAARQELAKLLQEEDRPKHGGNMTQLIISSLWNQMNVGICALEKVVQELDPCCIRSLAFLGSAYSIRWRFAMDATAAHPEQFGLCQEEELEKAAVVLQRAISLGSIFGEVLGKDSKESDSQATLLLQLEEIFILQGRMEDARKLTKLH